MQQDSTTAGLDVTFEAWVRALNNVDLDAFASFFDEDSETLDEDFPWRMSKSEFLDHLLFHIKGAGLWESFEYVTRETNTKVWGTTGHVSGFSTLRGKPRDAGFRQRFMGFTTTWYYANEEWRLVSWHQSVLAGRIDGASPS